MDNREVRMVKANYAYQSMINIPIAQTLITFALILMLINTYSHKPAEMLYDLTPPTQEELDQDKYDTPRIQKLGNQLAYTLGYADPTEAKAQGKPIFEILQSEVRQKLSDLNPGRDIPELCVSGLTGVKNAPNIKNKQYLEIAEFVAAKHCTGLTISN